MAERQCPLRAAVSGGSRWRSWLVGAMAAVVMAAGVVVGPVPAHADLTLDMVQCRLQSTGSISVSSPSVIWGDTIVVSWTVNPSSYCSSGAGPLIEVYADGRRQFSGWGHNGAYQGTISLTPAQTTSAALALSSGGESRVLASAPVTVNPYMPAPLPSGQTTVTIVANDVVARRLFVRAVQTPNATVHIAGDVDLDLSGLEYLPIFPGVQILGTRSSANPGPRLYTTTFPPILFSIGNHFEGTAERRPSDNVRISGIRLEGAETGIADGDTAGSIGIAVVSSINVEIDHNEISRWRGAGVEVRDPPPMPGLPGRIGRANATAVRVHDNYIHHNLHYGSEGYGVAVYESAYALIERNVFDYNRHAIAAEGSSGTGYLAYRNLVLQGGGLNSGFPFYMNTHQFDVHGTEDCWGFELYCGQAGEYFDMRYNTILYTAGTAIKVRGTPTDGADVAHNVFAHSQEWGGYLDDAALVQIDGNNLRAVDNRFGLDTLIERQGCADFDGDGISDDFMATGVTWWYASSALGGQWVYLADHEGVGDACDSAFKSDMLWRHSNGQVAIWFMDGGTITGDVYPGGQDPTLSWTIQGTGDFDADGHADIVWRHTNGQPAIWFMRDGAIVGEAYPGGPDPGLTWTIQRVGDFDGDGHADILWRHVSGQLAIWFKGDIAGAAYPGYHNFNDGLI